MVVIGSLKHITFIKVLFHMDHEKVGSLSKCLKKKSWMDEVEKKNKLHHNYYDEGDFIHCYSEDVVDEQVY
jgi:hypothetical protein